MSPGCGAVLPAILPRWQVTPGQAGAHQFDGEDGTVISLSLAEIASVTSGTLHDVPDPAVRVTGPWVCDSR